MAHAQASWQNVQECHAYGGLEVRRRRSLCDTRAAAVVVERAEALFVCNGFGWHPGLAHKCSAIAVVMFHMLASVRSRRARQRRKVAAAGHISSMALAAEYWAAWFESVSDREQLVS